MTHHDSLPCSVNPRHAPSVGVANVGGNTYRVCQQCRDNFSLELVETIPDQDHGYRRLTRPLFLDDATGTKINAGYLAVGVGLILLALFVWWLSGKVL